MTKHPAQFTTARFLSRRVAN